MTMTLLTRQLTNDFESRLLYEVLEEANALREYQELTALDDIEA